jgi:hypothetical protein
VSRADHRDHHIVDERHRRLPEGQRHAASEQGERERCRQRQRDRSTEVLTDVGGEAPAEAERTGMDHRAEAAAERAHDVAPHADGCGNEDDEARELGEGVAESGEREARDEVAARAD